MVWWKFAFGAKPPAPPAPVLTAAAVPVPAPDAKLVSHAKPWQDEAWGYYDTLGEYNYAVTWKSAMLSRVRLIVAEIVPGQDEPVRSEDDTAMDVLGRLSGGPTGQSQMMANMGVQLDIPGECFLVGETLSGVERWAVRSTDEVRVRHEAFQVVAEASPTDRVEWRPVGANAMIIRVYRPHKRWSSVADSPARAARGTMRELELVNRHILAQYLSRISSSGMVVFPDEVTFPTREEFADAPDPFVAEWIEQAATAIREPGTASSVVPMPIKVPGEYVDKVRFVDFTTAHDSDVIAKRDSAIKRLATQVNIPAEVLLGMGDVNHWCTLERVRIMTRTGWKTHDQLTAGEEVLTLNHDTGLSEWQPLLSVNTWNVTDEPMVTITGRRHSSTTTLNHRWPILSGESRNRGRDWTTTEELMRGAQAAGEDTQRHEYMVLAAPSADIPTEPKYQDALVELVAWYFTEGSKGLRPGRNTPKVTIYQSPMVNPDNCARIRRALTNLFGAESETLDKGGRYSTPDSLARRAEARSLGEDNPRMSNAEIGRRLGVSRTMVGNYLTQEAKTSDTVPRWREVSKDKGRMVAFRLNAAAGQVILDHAPRRVVPLEFIQELTATQLDLFIDTAVRGDGHLMGGVTPVLGQKDREMCDAFELACILSGRSVNRYEHTTKGLSADGPRTKTQHMVTATDRSLTFAPRGRSFEETQYTGTIWCPTTANRSWLAEDNGHVFYTGNSAWQIEEGAVKTAIAPDAELICDALTTSYLQPRLRASGVDNPERFVIWYDLSELTLKPDRSDDAIQLYDRLEIGGGALRRETGFNDDDKPEGEELGEQALKLILRSYGANALTALSELTGDTIEPAPISGGQTPAAPAESPQVVERQAPEPPTAEQAARARMERATAQAQAPHAVRFGIGGRTEILHPAMCEQHAYSCPFTHAALKLKFRPGTSGTYTCTLDAFGMMRVGIPTPNLDSTLMMATGGFGAPRIR